MTNRGRSIVYNIVILGYGEDWNDYMLKTFQDLPNVTVINERYPYPRTKVARFLCRLHFSKKINRFINLPNKSLWYHSFCDTICHEKSQPLIIVIYDYCPLAYDEKFLKYIRKHFANSMQVCLIIDILKKSILTQKGFSNKLNDYFDRVYTYSLEDAYRYGYCYQPNLYPYFGNADSEIHFDVIFVGRAKDRYSRLIQYYDRFKELGLTVQFYIANVCEDELLIKEDIFYESISYKDYVNLIRQSKCILDINQSMGVGYSLRVCEAISFEKKLITDNKAILDAPFYDCRYINVASSPEKISVNFLAENVDVRFPEAARDYFSGKHFLEKLESDLINYE